MQLTLTVWRLKKWKIKRKTQEMENKEKDSRNGKQKEKKKSKLIAWLTSILELIWELLAIK